MAVSGPPIAYIFLTQSLGAVSELCGQRIGRVCHHGSSLRMCVSASVYCALQAFVLLGLAELVLPREVTGGQGSFGMWRIVVAHPAVLVNTLNNVIYWLALVRVLREPLGNVLVVLAFLSASFLVGPVQAAVGMPQGPAVRLEAVTLGVVGALACVFEASDLRRYARRAWERLTNCPGGHWGMQPALNPSMQQERPPGESDNASCVQPEHAHTVARTSQDEPHAPEETTSVESEHLIVRAPADPGAAPRPAPSSPILTLPSGLTTSQWLPVLAAYTILAVTTCIGVVVMGYFEQEAGLNSFGYAAIDQVLLPLGMLPTVAFLYRTPWLRHWCGDDDDTHWLVLQEGNVWTVLRYTWEELIAVHRPATPDEETQRDHGEPPTAAYSARSYARYFCLTSFFPALIGFHGMEFIRTLLLFYLVTQFDATSTYIQMTLLRVMLCWIAAVAACTVFRGCTGITLSEARAALSRSNIALRLCGSVMLLCSAAMMQGVL